MTTSFFGYRTHLMTTSVCFVFFLGGEGYRTYLMTTLGFFLGTEPIWWRHWGFFWGTEPIWWRQFFLLATELIWWRHRFFGFFFGVQNPFDDDIVLLGTEPIWWHVILGTESIWWRHVFFWGTEPFDDDIVVTWLLSMQPIYSITIKLRIHCGCTNSVNEPWRMFRDGNKSDHGLFRSAPVEIGIDLYKHTP